MNITLTNERSLMKNNVFNHLIVIVGLIMTTVCTAWSDEEQTLIAVLQSNAGVVEKCDACRQLRICGTAQSVGALSAMLGDERVGHAARYALEGMPYEEAGAALRDAVGKTSGGIKAGLIDSIGWRRDETAVELLKPLLSDSDTSVATSTASALGRIGGAEAEAVLVKACGTTGGNVRIAVLDALLRCAENRQNAGDNSGAAAVYRNVMEADTSPAIYAAAWRGLVLSDSNQRPELVVKALLKGDDSLQRVAIKLVREVKDENLVKSCLKKWDSLPAAAQLAVLDTHLQFGDEALETMRTASKSQYPVVRIAALQAMADLSNPSLIPEMVCAVSNSEPSEKEAARDALARVHGPGVQEALLTYLDQAKTAEKIELLIVLGRRGSTDVVPFLLKTASAPDQAVRLAAMESLSRLAVSDSLVPLLDLLAGSESELDRNAAIKALYAVCQASPDKDESGRLVVAAMNRMPAAERRYVFPLLAKIATPDALMELQKATQSDDKQLVQDAIGALTQWPSAAPASNLLEKARNSKDPYLRILALRGAITVAGREPDLSARLAILREALAMANRTEEKRLALSQLGQIHKAEAIELSMQYLDDPAIANEAALAVTGIAEQLVYTSHKEAKDAMERILKTSPTPSIAQAAQKILSKCEIHIPNFLVTWQISAPYTTKSQEQHDIFAVRFAPESKHGDIIPWLTIVSGSNQDFPYKIDINKMFAQENCTAYCRTKVWSDENRKVRVEIGSDDGFKFWINGRLYGKNDIARGYQPSQDVFDAELKKGWNLVMIKVTQLVAGWEFSVKMTELDGSPISNLSSSVDINEEDLPLAFEPTFPGSVIDIDGTLQFERLRIGDVTYEAASVFDVDKNGVNDIVSGEYWFEGPDFTQKHKICTVQPKDDYYDDFSDFPMDVNGDGYLDIITGGWWGETLRWRENPKGQPVEWTVHDIDKPSSIETTRFWDVNGDGFVEIVPNAGGSLVAYELLRDENGKGIGQFKKHTLHMGGVGHGLGFGDINGDGRGDFVATEGWFEAPEKPFEGKWVSHQEFNLGATSIPILVYDVDGNGMADLIEGSAHGYGLNWWQQTIDAQGKRAWIKHEIDPNRSQYHELAMADLDKDGKPELITGKRYRAHGDNDPGAFDPVGLYYFKIVDGAFKRVTLDYGPASSTSGAGIYLWVEDIDGNGYKDIVAPGKGGLYLFKNLGPKD